MIQQMMPNAPNMKAKYDSASCTKRRNNLECKKGKGDVVQRIRAYGFEP